ALAEVETALQADLERRPGEVISGPEEAAVLRQLAAADLVFGMREDRPGPHAPDPCPSPPRAIDEQQVVTVRDAEGLDLWRGVLQEQLQVDELELPTGGATSPAGEAEGVV